MNDHGFDNTADAPAYEANGVVYTTADIAKMRKELEAVTGLNLGDLSPRGVVLNYLVRIERRAT
jgi:hypothetical protein